MLYIIFIISLGFDHQSLKMDLCLGKRAEFTINNTLTKYIETRQVRLKHSLYYLPLFTERLIHEPGALRQRCQTLQVGRAFSAQKRSG
jgi:hypothetical protein